LIFAAYFSVFDFTVSSFFTFAAPAIPTALDSIAVFSSLLGTGPLSVTVQPRDHLHVVGIHRKIFVVDNRFTDLSRQVTIAPTFRLLVGRRGASILLVGLTVIGRLSKDHGAGNQYTQPAKQYRVSNPP
jgi:hypothetical protein